MGNPTQNSFPDLPVGKFALTSSAGVEYNASNPLPTTATISGDVNVDSLSIDTSGLVGKPSGGDFTTAYASATTITCGTYPDGSSVTHDDIVTVIQIATGGTVTATYSRDDSGMSMSGNVLTVASATFAASDSFVIYTNVPRYITGAGAVGTQVQRVTLGSDDPAVTSLAIVDDWDESDRAKVNPIVGQAGVAAGAGVVSVTTQRTTLGSDDPAVVSLAIIDDWDESDRAKVNLISGQAGITGGAGAVGASTPRVTHASDDPVTTAVQLIDDAVYVDGATFTPASSKGILLMAEADETTPVSVSEGQAGGVRMTLTRFLKVSLGDLLSGEDQTNNLLQVVEKPLAVSTYTPDLDTSAAAEASSVTKASAGNLYGVTFSNGTGSTVYLQFFNSTTVPADTTVPVITLVCPANSTLSAEWPKGRQFTTGIAWAASTTQNTKTIGGSSFLADVNYK